MLNKPSSLNIIKPKPNLPKVSNCSFYICSADVGNRELEAVAEMREAVQMVETAALEKEQVGC